MYLHHIKLKLHAVLHCTLFVHFAIAIEAQCCNCLQPSQFHQPTSLLLEVCLPAIILNQMQLCTSAILHSQPNAIVGMVYWDGSVLLLLLFLVF